LSPVDLPDPSFYFTFDDGVLIDTITGSEFVATLLDIYGPFAPTREPAMVGGVNYEGIKNDFDTNQLDDLEECNLCLQAPVTAPTTPYVVASVWANGALGDIVRLGMAQYNEAVPAPVAASAVVDITVAGSGWHHYMVEVRTNPQTDGSTADVYVDGAFSQRVESDTAYPTSFVSALLGVAYGLSVDEAMYWLRTEALTSPASWASCLYNGGSGWFLPSWPWRTCCPDDDPEHDSYGITEWFAYLGGDIPTGWDSNDSRVWATKEKAYYHLGTGQWVYAGNRRIVCPETFSEIGQYNVNENEGIYAVYDPDSEAYYWFAGNPRTPGADVYAYALAEAGDPPVDTIGGESSWIPETFVLWAEPPA
jgi:hypothetical protein